MCRTYAVVCQVLLTNLAQPVSAALCLAGAVLDPSLQRVYPYLLLIAFAGVFALLGLRNLLIITWRCAELVKRRPHQPATC